MAECGGFSLAAQRLHLSQTAISHRMRKLEEALGVPLLVRSGRGIAPLLQRIYESFGPRRFFWGSDVSRLPCSLRQALEHFLHELPFIAEADKPLVMGGALSRVLRWAEPPEIAPPRHR